MDPFAALGIVAALSAVLLFGSMYRDAKAEGMEESTVGWAIILTVLAPIAYVVLAGRVS